MNYTRKDWIWDAVVAFLLAFGAIAYTFAWIWVGI